MSSDSAAGATTYLLACLECAPIVMPFGSAAGRGRWGSAHTRATGHDRWWVHDQLPGQPAASPEPPPAPAMIVVQVPGREPAVFHQGFTIGRYSADAALDDEYVSAPHAWVQPVDGQWQAMDLGSTNGTHLNGTRIYGPTPLAKGDKLRVGRTVLTVVPG